MSDPVCAALSRPDPIAALDDLAERLCPSGVAVVAGAAAAVPALVGALDAVRSTRTEAVARVLLDLAVVVAAEDPWAALRAHGPAWVAWPARGAGTLDPGEQDVRDALVEGVPAMLRVAGAASDAAPAVAAVVRELARSGAVAPSGVAPTLRAAPHSVARAVLRQALRERSGCPPPPGASGWERAVAAVLGDGPLDAAEAWILGAPAAELRAAVDWSLHGVFADVALPLAAARPALAPRLVARLLDVSPHLEAEGRVLLTLAFFRAPGPPSESGAVTPLQARAVAAVSAPVLARGSVGPLRALRRFGLPDPR